MLRAFYAIQSRSWFGWILLCGLAWPGLASAAPAALVLTAGQPTFLAAGHLALLDDPSHQLTVDEALQSSQWKTLPGDLSAGYTHSALWLKLPLQVESLPTSGWVLKLGNALIDRAEVMQVQPDGSWRLLGRGGEETGRDHWPVDYRSPAFVFSPTHTGPQTLLIRLESKNALASPVEMWERLSFDNASRREGLFFGLYFGFYLLLICVFGTFWMTNRAPMSGLFLIYLGGCVLNEAMSLGLIQQFTYLPVAWSDPLLGSSIACSLLVGALISVRQLALKSVYPRVNRLLVCAVAVIALGCIAVIVSGHYALGMIPVQLTALLLIVIFSTLAVRLAARSHAPARAFMIIFGVFYLGVLISFLRNLSILPVRPWTEHASALGTMVHMVLLGGAIVGRHERNRRMREREQANLVAELAIQDNQRLERQVAHRTAELSTEILQRKKLEEELREALEKERRIGEEQRDFVAMVSHELRTPLAVINTSAQQLSNNLDAPLEKSLRRCRNIRDATKRLLVLVDEYLTVQRMSETQLEPRLRRCHPQSLIHQLSQEFPDDRITFAISPALSSLDSDAGLLQIALRNLLANGHRHAPPNATIHVSLHTEAHMLHIHVSHPGEAIAPQDSEQLFQKYFRGRNAQHRPGAGLGLYIVHTIARKLGGQVALVSAGGAEPICFRLSLPLWLDRGESSVA